MTSNATSRPNRAHRVSGRDRGRVDGAPAAALTVARRRSRQAGSDDTQRGDDQAGQRRAPSPTSPRSGGRRRTPGAGAANALADQRAAPTARPAAAATGRPRASTPASRSNLRGARAARAEQGLLPAAPRRARRRRLRRSAGRPAPRRAGRGTGTAPGRRRRRCGRRPGRRRGCRRPRPAPADARPRGCAPRRSPAA